jgi:manganese/zinc/iron transport system permease protein
MDIAYIEILITAVLATTACVIPGVFLVLRRTAMLSDAISHSVLFGIVIAFLVVQDLGHPALIIGAALTGLLTVLMVELLNRTGRVHGDTAIGLVFPLLFSVAVILISKYAGNVHLDTDSVLSGEIAFVPFNRLVLGGVDVGPKPAWVLGGVLLLNLLFVLLFYKELKVSTFDPELAAAQGYHPKAIHYALMTLVSLTVVAAFETVGSLLVIALLIVPAATAYLVTNRLAVMLIAGVVAGIIASVSGFAAAIKMDISISGSIVVAGGVLFMLVLLLEPRTGLVSTLRMRRRQRSDFAGDLLAVHLLNHFSSGDRSESCSAENLAESLNWTPIYAESACKNLLTRRLVVDLEGSIQLTEKGTAVARAAMTL